MACHSMNYLIGKTGHVTVLVVVEPGVDAMSALGLAVPIVFDVADAACAMIV